MRLVRRFNLHTARAEFDADDPDGYGAAAVRVGPAIGAALLGGTVYELPPGQSNCPYHYEYGNEEWLIVLGGRLSLRHPAGEDELEAGDVVCFIAGPQGAHQLRNRTEDTVRVLMLSTMAEPSVAVYPDSDKIGVWPGNPDDHVMLRRGDGGVDYWDGER
jgi:uncharacterized cupin superfamily protein